VSIATIKRADRFTASTIPPIERLFKFGIPCQALIGRTLIQVRHAVSSGNLWHPILEWH